MACTAGCVGTTDLMQVAALQMQTASNATVKLNTSSNTIIFGKPKIITK
jgi:hypothetical protein